MKNRVSRHLADTVCDVNPELLYMAVAEPGICDRGCVRSFFFIQDADLFYAQA